MQLYLPMVCMCVYVCMYVCTILPLSRYSYTKSACRLVWTFETLQSNTKWKSRSLCVAPFVLLTVVPYTPVRAIARSGTARSRNKETGTDATREGIRRWRAGTAAHTLMSGLSRGELSASRLGRFTSGEPPSGTHWLGCSVCPITGEEINPFLLSGIEPWPHGCPAVSRSLRCVYRFGVQCIGCLVTRTN